MNVIKRALAAFIACFAMNAAADEVILMGLSKHVNTTVEHNEQNWGFGYVRTFKGRDWQVGVYKNSYWRKSTFVMTDIYRYDISPKWYFHMPAGVVTGYEKPIMPIVLPVLAYRATEHVTIDTMILPGVGGRQGIFAVQARIRF